MRRVREVLEEGDVEDAGKREQAGKHGEREARKKCSQAGAEADGQN